MRNAVFGVPFYVAPRWCWYPIWKYEPLIGLFQNLDEVDWDEHRRFGIRIWIFEIGWRGGGTANAPNWLRVALEQHAPRAWRSAGKGRHMSSLYAVWLFLGAVLAIVRARCIQ